MSKKPVKLLFVAACAATATSSFAINLLNETFTYANGPLVTVSAGAWATHSGTALQQDVLSGKLILTESESEDTNRSFGVQAGTTWMGFELNMTGVPSGTGGYLAHFTDAAASNFRCRIFVKASTTPNRFNLGISNGAATGTYFANDFSYNTNYRVIASANSTGTACSVEVLGITGTLNATDVQGAAAVARVAFRQNFSAGAGMGAAKVDNLTVATSRIEVVPEPSSMFALGLGAALAVGLRLRRG